MEAITNALYGGKAIFPAAAICLFLHSTPNLAIQHDAYNAPQLGIAAQIDAQQARQLGSQTYATQSAHEEYTQIFETFILNIVNRSVDIDPSLEQAIHNNFWDLV